LIAVASHQPIPIALLDQAGEVFALDTLIQNSDRLVTNPNCLTDGSQFVVYDHELAFLFDILGWKAPWIRGALDLWTKGEPHLFYLGLKGKVINLKRFLDALKAIPPARLAGYVVALPVEWNKHKKEADRMVDHLRALRANADAALAEVSRVLT
jgi:hypothetical protein